MRCAIYARVSKERCPREGCGHVYTEHPKKGACQHAGCKCRRYEGQDPENQLIELRQYAKSRKAESVVEYIDYETGKHSDRDAFRLIFADASRRKFDLMVVWALDRLSREGILETLQHLRRLRDYGVEFESYSEAQFRSTGPGGDLFVELMISLSAWMARQERERISERTKAGLQRARSKGRIGGRPPKIFDRERARQMRDQVPPMSWRAIAREMTAHHGYEIAQSSIRKALKGVHKTSSQNSRKRVAKKR